MQSLAENSRKIKKILYRKKKAKSPPKNGRNKLVWAGSAKLMTSKYEIEFADFDIKSASGKINRELKKQMQPDSSSRLERVCRSAQPLTKTVANKEPVRPQSSNFVTDHANSPQKRVQSAKLNPSTKKQKTRLCKTFMSNGFCLSKNCPYAHAKNELEVPYMPQIWVQYFSGEKGKRGQDNIDKIQNNKGQTILHLHVQRNEVREAVLALEKGANPTKKDWRGYDSLYIAISNRNEQIVKAILSRKSDLKLNSVHFSKKTTYLLEAIHLHDYRVMQLLLDAGADPNIRNCEGKTALIICLQNLDMEALKILLSNKETRILEPDSQGKLPLQYAIEQGLEKEIFILYRSETYSKEVNLKVLGVALCKNDLRLVDQVILREPGWMNYEDEGGNSLLMILFKRDYIDSMLYFLENYPLREQLVKPNFAQEQIILECMRAGNVRLAKFLITRIVDVEHITYQKHILLLAAELGQYEIVDMLLALPRTNPNKYDDMGRSPLILAARGGHVETVDSILKSRIPINAHWKDHEDKNARKHAWDQRVRTLINNYMVETHQETESLLNELGRDSYIST